MEVFDWVPDQNFTEEYVADTREAKFRFGYSVRAASGINNFRNKWNLRFNNRRLHTINRIDWFFREKAGTEAFYWYLPDSDEPVTVKCVDWNVTVIEVLPGYGNGFASLNAVFEEVHN